jgi:hypothetical protein
LLALAIVRARATGRWPRLVPPVAASIAILALAFQLVVRPALARSRGFQAFMPVVARLVPPAEPLYAYLPLDPSVRYYAPRPVMNWKERPADRDVYLLAWEREVEKFPERTSTGVERLASSEARHGRRGVLVLVRVPAGALPPRRAPADGSAAQNG